MLQGIYETNQHPAGDETWRDPRGREGASLGDTAELDLLESKIPADLLDMAKAAFWKKAAPLFARLVWSRMLQDHATRTQPNTHFFSSLSSPNSHMQHFAEPKKVKSQVVVHSILHRKSKNCSWRRSAMMPRWLSPTACLTKTRRTWLAEHVGICRKITVVLDSLGHCGSISGWWFQTFVIFHNIWDNPSH